MEIRNARVLITGAAVRIGRAIALSFAQAGARVVVHCHRSVRQGKELVEELMEFGEGHELAICDLCDPAARSMLIPELVAEGGRLDCLVNSASVYRRAPLLDIDEQRTRDDYEINFVAPFMLMRAFAHVCRRGSIINILDQRVATVDPSAGTYGFAKKSLRDATKAAAVQWAPDIRVNAVAPGLVLPPPGVSPEKMKPLLANIPMGVASSPDEVAEACLFLGRSETITGHVLYVDGGLHLVGAPVAEVASADYGAAG